jgi:hypothetical protein
MRRINFSPYGASTSEQTEVAAAMKSGDLWVEVTDPLSRWKGCIGKIDLSTYYMDANYHRNHSHRSSAAHNKDFESLCGYYNKLPLWMDKKSIKVKVSQSAEVVALLDYSGPAVYTFNRNPLPEIPTQVDILGCEIIPGAFVAASGGTGMYLAKVKEIFQERYGHNSTRIRARLEIIIDAESPFAAEQRNQITRMIGHVPEDMVRKETTVAIENLMVMTPDMKQLAMITKLSRT